MNLMEVVKQAQIKVEQLEKHLFQGDYSNLIIELICKNKQEENTKPKDIQEISACACEGISKDIKKVMGM